VDTRPLRYQPGLSPSPFICTRINRGAVGLFLRFESLMQIRLHLAGNEAQAKQMKDAAAYAAEVTARSLQADTEPSCNIANMRYDGCRVASMF
jgi:hypothetical protein